MKHLGNLTVTADNLHSFPAVSEIYGHLIIAEGVTLRAPKLVSVRGWVTLRVSATLDAPVLGLVDGWLTLKEKATLNAIHLAEVRADLVLATGALFSAEALTLVGSINVQRGAANLWPLGQLKEVRDSVTLSAGAELVVLALERIGKSLTLREHARLDAPNLSHIGGYADIDETATVVMPKFIGD